MAPAPEAGVLREGIEPGDVSTATKMLGAAIRPMDGLLLPEAAWDRYLDVVLSRPGEGRGRARRADAGRRRGSVHDGARVLRKVRVERARFGAAAFGTLRA